MRSIVAAAVTALLACAPARAAEDPLPSDPAALRLALAGILERTHTPGLSVALVSKDQVLWADGIGLADVAQKSPATADTLFRIGSATKAFTALAALKLRAEGRLDFDAPYASRAPEIEFQNPWEATDPVRIVHLLEHTSGFEDVHLREYANQDARPNNLRDALAFDPDSRVSRWRPGTWTSYCNSGPPMVAYVIEKITGEPFEDYVRRTLFEPIGMTTATYFLTPDVEERLTRLYGADGVTPYPYWHIAIRPAGAINASAKDMAAYLRFYLNRGRVGTGALLSEADLERMEHPQTTLAVKSGLPNGYGLYNYASIDQDGFVWHGHAGGVQGGASEIFYLPEAGVGYAFMVNATNGTAIPDISKLLRRYLTRNATKPIPPPPVAVAADLVRRFEGFYVSLTARAESQAWLGRIMGVGRMRFDEHGASIGAALGGMQQRVVGAGGNLLRLEKAVPPSFAMIDDPELGALLVADMQAFRKIPALVAFAPLALVASAVLLAISAVLFVPVWAWRGWRGTIQLRQGLGARVWPLASAVTTLSFVGAFFLMGTDPKMLEHYGHLTWRSLASATISVLIPIVAVLGLIAVLRGSRGMHRGLYWHALLVLALDGLTGLYLVAAGGIPFVTWR